MALRSLPGSDKYRQASQSDPPWRHPLVEKANAEVPIAEVLSDYFATPVPAEAEGWKVRCPFAVEHEDGGIDRQFRVYASSNSGYCFALHGRLDPVRLWRLRSWFPSLKDAAEDLLRTYGIDYRPRPYKERMAGLRTGSAFEVDTAALVQALQVYLVNHPLYEARQYDDSLLRGVNYILNEAHDACAQAERLGDVERWLDEAKQRVSALLRQTRPRSALGGTTA